MKKLLLIRDSLANKISYYHIILLLATLPFDQFYSHLVFVSFALHTLVHLKKERLKLLLRPVNLVLQALFFLTLISFTYTGYPADAFADITRQLLILLFPVFFSLTALNISKYRENLLKFFAIVCTVTVGYLYIHAFIVIQYFKLPAKAILSVDFINHNFSQPIGMHATFFSLQVAVAFFYMVSQLVKKQPLLNKVFYSLAALLLLAGLVQLGSKSVSLVVLAGVNIAVPYFLIARRNVLSYIIITCSLSALLIVGAFHSYSLKARYITTLKTDLSAARVDEISDSRLARWGAAVQLIKRSPLVGYGAGAELNELDGQFYNQKLYNAYLNKLNAHNQYLSFLITSGLIGLIVYMSTLLIAFRIAWTQNDLMFFIFILLVAFVSLSESLLNAEKGVYFYSLFLSFFIFSSNYQSMPLWPIIIKKLSIKATKRRLTTSSL